MGNIKIVMFVRLKILEKKKNKLKENIKSLEELSNSFNNILKELKEIFEKVEKKKFETKSSKGFYRNKNSS